MTNPIQLGAKLGQGLLGQLVIALVVPVFQEVEVVVDGLGSGHDDKPPGLGLAMSRCPVGSFQQGLELFLRHWTISGQIIVLKDWPMTIQSRSTKTDALYLWSDTPSGLDQVQGLRGQGQALQVHGRGLPDNLDQEPQDQSESDGHGQEHGRVLLQPDLVGGLGHVLLTQQVLQLY